MCPEIARPACPRDRQKQPNCTPLEIAIRFRRDVASLHQHIQSWSEGPANIGWAPAASEHIRRTSGPRHTFAFRPPSGHRLLRAVAFQRRCTKLRNDANYHQTFRDKKRGQTRHSAISFFYLSQKLWVELATLITGTLHGRSDFVFL